MHTFLPKAQRRFAWAACLVTVGATAALAWAYLWPLIRHDTPTGVEAIALAAGSVRPIEARLCGGFAYGRYEPPPIVRGTQAEGKREFGPSETADRVVLASVAAEALVRATEDKSAAAARAAAAAELLRGEATMALARLEPVARIRGTEAEVFSDLAALYLDRARVRNTPRDVIRALETIDLARAVSSVPEVLFNRALILEHAALLPDADAAWHEYLAADSDSPWAVEARDHIAALRASSTTGLDEIDGADLNDATDPERLLAIVRENPQAARARAFVLLFEQWPKAVDGDAERAARTLAGARSIGAALEAEGDSFVTDAARAVSVKHAMPARVHALAMAYAAYAEGLRCLSVGDVVRARLVLNEASVATATSSDAVAIASALALVECDAHGVRYERALARLPGIRRDAIAHRYPHLAARVRWVSAFALGMRQRYATATRELEAALAEYEAIRDWQSVARVHVMLAAGFCLTGAEAEALVHQRIALTQVRRFENPRMLSNVLVEAARQLHVIGHPRAALYYADEGVAIARDLDDVSLPAFALLNRCVYRLALEDSRADADLDEAAGFIDRIVDPTNREWYLAFAKWVRGELLLQTDASEAIRAIDEAAEFFHRTEDRGYETELSLLRGKAYLELGDVDAAEAAFDSGIASVEERWREMARGKTYRPSNAAPRGMFHEPSEIYDEMISLQIERRGDVVAAHDTLERARARGLLESLRGDDYRTLLAVRRSEPVTTRDLMQVLPPDVAVVSYAIVGERLYTWVLSSAGAWATSGEASDLAESAVRLRELITRRVPEGIDATAADLYDSLVAPVSSRIPEGAMIVFVRDLSLHGIPFALLRNRATQRCLVEDHASAVAPSASVLVACLRKREKFRLRDPGGSWLVAGNPDFESAAYPHLRPLPAAESEARSVAALYGSSTLLIGEDATKAAFLTGARTARSIHFAGHAVADYQSPLDSFLLFAGGPGDDRLTAAEVERAPLAGVEIAVLAACDTANGDVFAGEGAVHVARAFLAAGVPSVVAGLWAVEDEATATLVTEFHRNLAAGAGPALALRDAQLVMLHSPDPRLREPSAWASLEALGAP